jgi:glycosyltransferase involved in cell wall biosynthesis
MNVLQVVEPGVDGVFRHVEGLTQFLASRSLAVSLAYSDVRGSEGLRRLVREVEAHGGKTLNLEVGNKPGPRDVLAALKLRRLIAEVKPDIIHAHSSKAGGLLRLPFVAGRSKPVFYTPHAYYGMARRAGAGPWVFDRVESVLARRGTTINISRDEAEFARARLKVPESRQRVIHNPVRTDTFQPASAEAKAAARRAFDVPEGAIAIGTVGRMTFQKDPETLYRAIAPLLRRRPDLFLMHLGEGELEGELKRLSAELMIERQVRFAGYAENPLAFYQALDALAMTSRYEAGWPIVILEALACGLPIVSSIAPGTADIDRAGLSHCWTAEAGDVAGFEAALTALIDDLPQARTSNHRELAVSRFSPEACYGAVLGEYRDAVARRTGARPARHSIAAPSAAVPSAAAGGPSAASLDGSRAARPELD